MKAKTKVKSGITGMGVNGIYLAPKPIFVISIP